MIRELQNRSQAKIQIDHAGVSGMTVEQKQVSITGTEQAVVKAEEMIKFLAANPLMEGLQAINMLVEEKLRGGQWGSGPPYPGLPNHGLNMQPEGSGQHFTNYPPSAAAPVGVVPGVVGDYQMPHAHMGTPPIVGYGSNVPVSSLPSYGGGQEVDVVYAQKQFMGRIIGKKGITINDLQRRSSCDIQVNQDVPVGQDCEITIRGTRQGIEQAKQMIREIIDVGPQHPVRSTIPFPFPLFHMTYLTVTLFFVNLAIVCRWCRHVRNKWISATAAGLRPAIFWYGTTNLCSAICLPGAHTRRLWTRAVSAGLSANLVRSCSNRGLWYSYSTNIRAAADTIWNV